MTVADQVETDMATIVGNLRATDVKAPEAADYAPTQPMPDPNYFNSMAYDLITTLLRGVGRIDPVSQKHLLEATRVILNFDRRPDRAKSTDGH